MITYLKRIFIFFIFVFFAGCGILNFESQNHYDANLIIPDNISKYLYFLASDSLKGRNTPSEGLDIAAEYIANNFKNFGLKPVGENYYQNFSLIITNLGSENHLKILKNGNINDFQIKQDFTPFEMTANAEVNAPLVFAGYGIKSKEHNYNDYQNVNVKDKIVLVLRHEPGEEDSTSIFDGKKPTEYSNVSQKVKTAIEEGAIGVLVVTDPLNHSNLTPRGFPWPSLSKTIPVESLPITLNLHEPKVPVVQVGESIIQLIFGSVDSLKNIQAHIDSTLQPNSFEFQNIEVNLKTSTILTEKNTKNVAAYVEGADKELRNEVVIIGAHYDHVGYKRNAEVDTDSIFNGADDNASGTSGMLAIAKAFSEMKNKPKRTVLFLAFAGEEKGLLGSKYYVNFPLFPIEKTVAMLNLDMIGRNHIDSVFILGASHSPDLFKIVEEENKNINFHLITSDGYFVGGSDHASFYRRNIPVIFFFTGEHSDYHKVSDHAELIDIKKLTKVSRLAFRTAWRIANDNKYYKLIK